MTMLPRRTLLAALAMLMTTATWTAPAPADQADVVLGRIARARSSLKSLQARFHQRRRIGLLATAVLSRGLLTIVHPGRLRWDLAAPDSVSYWIGPEGLAMKNREGVTRLGKAGAGRFGAVLGDLLLMLGGDLRKLRGRYAITARESKGKLVLEAKPKSKLVAKHIAKLSMVAGKKLWTVERVEIHETNGDSSTIDFEPPVRDRAIEPAFMKPPAGT